MASTRQRMDSAEYGRVRYSSSSWPAPMKSRASRVVGLTIRSAGIERPPEWSSVQASSTRSGLDLGIDDPDGHVAAGRQQGRELADLVERDRVEATGMELGDDGVALRLRQQERDGRPAVRGGHADQPSASGSRAVTCTTPSAVLVTRAAKPGMVGTASRKETSGRWVTLNTNSPVGPGGDGHGLDAGEAAEMALEARDAGDGHEARRR